MMDRAYHRTYSRNYYHKRRDELIELLGGRCAICGSTEKLEFDHIDAGNKSFSIGKLLSRSKADTEQELSKCQLLCRECHIRKSKDDIRAKLSGSKNPFYNKHGKDFPSSKTCIDLDTGLEYESATEYAEAFQLNRNSVSRVCRGEQKAIQGHHVLYKHLLPPS